MDREEVIRWSEPEQVLLLLDKSSEELKEMLGDEFAVMKDYAQNNPHHCYNLLEHTVRTAAGMDCSGLSDEDAVQLRVAALFHDIGKPVVALQKNGKTVFYNHGKESRKIAEKRLPESGIEGSELKKMEKKIHLLSLLRRRMLKKRSILFRKSVRKREFIFRQ